MELHQFEIKARGHKRDTFYIVGLGDVHFGTQSFDQKKFKEMVRWIKKNPTCYWVGLGDYCELVTHRDLRRFDPTSVDRRFRIADLQEFMAKQVDAISELLEPIKDRCIGVACGNHEFDALRTYDFGATTRLAQNLRTKNLGWTCLTRLVFRRGYDRTSRALVMLTEHSNLSGRKPGGKVNRLWDRSNDFFDCDIILWGHSHDKTSTSKAQLYLPKNGKLQLKERKIVMGIVPSFYRSYEVGVMSYSERRGYSPTSMGILVIEISPWVGEENKLEMHISQ